MNPFDKKWELFDETITEDRHQMITDLVQLSCEAKLEDLREILGRSTSSCDRYVKQAIDSGYFDQ